VGAGFDPSQAGFRYSRINLEDLFRGQAGKQGRSAEGMGGFSDFFQAFFGQGGQPTWEFDPSSAREAGGFTGFSGAGATSRGQHLELELELTLEEAVFGTSKLIELKREDICPACGGSGVEKRHACRKCHGSGTLVTPRRLEVKVPPGVREGSRIRVAREGRAGSGGGDSGDLYLLVRLLPHSLFEVRGADLHLDLPVSDTEAVLGAEVEVPVIKGRVTMKIPPHTITGKVFRLRGQGLPATRGSEPGDLYIHVQITTPEKLSEPEKELYRQLAGLRKFNPRERLLRGSG